MIYILALLTNLVMSQNCSINQTLGSYLYPTSGSPFAMPLLNYFQGPGLNFSVSPSNQFKVSQYVTQKSFNQSLFNSDQIIQTISLDLFGDGNAQYGGYASLVFGPGQYQVYIGNQSVQGLTSNLIGLGISVQSYILCQNIAQYKNYLLVSCYDKQGYQIFYHYNLQNDSNQIPQPIMPNGGIKIYTDLYSQTWLTATYESLSYVISNQASNISYIYYYGITVQNSKLLIGFEENITTQGIFGYYAVLNQIVEFEIILYLNYLTILVPAASGYNISSGSQQTFNGLGVQCNYAQNPQIICYISIATNQGVQNLKLIFSSSYTPNILVQQGQFIQYPLGIGLTGYNIVIYLNQEYIYYTNGQYSMVLPGFSNNNTQYIWYSQQNLTYGVIFDALSSFFTIIQQNQYAIYQIQQPFLFTDLVSNSAGQIVVTAQTNANLQAQQEQCSILFNFEFILKTQSQPLSSLGYQNVIEQQQQLDYPFNSTQIISPLFYGSNITYTVTTNATNTQANVLQVSIQTFYSPSRFQFYYSQIIQNPNNTNEYMIATQISSLNYINIQFCYLSDCQLDSNQQYNLAVEQGMVAQKIAVGYNYVFQSQILCVLFTNPLYPFYCIDFNWGKPLGIVIEYFTLTIQKPIPTTSVADFAFVDNQFYVITQNPSSLQVYQSVSINNIYDTPQIIQDVNFNMRKLFYNTEIYKNLIFIDNVYELIIMQNLENNLIIQQTIQYPIQSGDCSIGIGLLSQGIYIAQSDGATNQIIQYYPKIIISQFAPITLNNNPQQINIPNQVTINNPVISTFTNDRFYIAWTYQNVQQVGIFQQSYGINNMLYLSYFVTGKQIQQLSASQLPKYDVVDCLADQQSETIFDVFNQTSVEFVQTNLSITNQTIGVNYTASFLNQQTQVTQTIQLVNLKSQVTTKLNITYNQTQYNYYYFPIQPQNYFIGLIKNYIVTASQYKGGPIYTPGIIQPIQSSNIFCNITPQALTTGKLSQYGDYILSFAQTNKSVYTYYQLHEQGQVNYTLLYNFPQNFSSCPIIIQITYCVLSICSLANNGSTFLTCFNLKDNKTTILTTLDNTSYSNIVSAQYQDPYLIFQYQDYFTFNKLTQQPGVLEITYNNQFNITDLQISQWSLIYFKNSYFFLQPYYGIVAVAQNGKTALMIYSYNFQNLSSTAIQFNPIITGINQTLFLLDKIISIFQLGGVQTESFFQIQFIVQTITNGYVYNFQVDIDSQYFPQENLFNQNFEAKQQQILIQYGSLQAIFMQFLKNYAVTVYSSGSQSVVGVYSFYDTTQNYLSFISYSEIFYNNSQPTQFSMTDNGTLYYLVDQGFSFFFTQPAPLIAVNYSQLNGNQLINKTSEFYNLQINLTAVNDFTQTTAEFNIVSYLYSGSQPNSNWSGSKSIWFGSVALLFVVIFIGTISVLCYKSRPQKRLDYP